VSNPKKKYVYGCVQELGKKIVKILDEFFEIDDFW
jgi:hypothetical protein